MRSGHYADLPNPSALATRLFSDRHCVLLRGVSFSGTEPFAHSDFYLPPGLTACSAKRRNEFLAGRYCARRALADAGADHTTVERDDEGLPLWPKGWVGSISHADGGAVAVVARAGTCSALGVDMERVAAAAQYEEIRALVALDGELELLTTLSPPQALTLLFSAKEALYKALYPGLRRFFDFSAARVVQWEGNRLTLMLTTPWGNTWPEGARIPVMHAFDGAHIYCAVALSAPIAT